MRIDRPERIGMAVATLLLTAGASPAIGQQVDPRAELRLPLPPAHFVGARGSIAAPAISIGVPTAFGAGWGDVFVGAGLQSRTRYADRVDGGAVVGFGLGDPWRFVGLEVSVSQFGTFRSCCRGGVSAKGHRMVTRATSVALGWENVTGWGRLPGGAENAHWTDGGSSLYGALSHIFLLREESYQPLSSVAVTVGGGNGRFRRERDILDGRERVNGFASVGVRVLEPLSVVASYTGQDVAAGASVVPFRRLPVVVTVGAADLTTDPRLVAGVGIGLSYPF
jgi:hypothetical protein